MGCPSGPISMEVICACTTNVPSSPIEPSCWWTKVSLISYDLRSRRKHRKGSPISEVQTPWTQEGPLLRNFAWSASSSWPQDHSGRQLAFAAAEDLCVIHLGTWARRRAGCLVGRCAGVAFVGGGLHLRRNFAAAFSDLFYYNINTR